MIVVRHGFALNLFAGHGGVPPGGLVNSKSLMSFVVGELF